MKKIITITLVLCLCVGLCACGGNSAPKEPIKSVEAQKADELILSIGEVSMENESAVLAAKAYYDTLTDEQKTQVENVVVLESAVKDLDALKKAEEYKEIYDKALEYENNLLIEDAFAEYHKLPSDYKDVARKLEVLEMYSGLAGTWKCDNPYQVNSIGQTWCTFAPSMKIAYYLSEKGDIQLKATQVSAEHLETSQNMFSDEGSSMVSLVAFSLQSGQNISLEQVDQNGVRISEPETITGNYLKAMYEFIYHFEGDNELTVVCAKKTMGQTITVEYTFTKQ